jgi:RimJ/RimL family protein N-acetyltransferase
VDYFHDASEAYLAGMGADRGLLPARDAWLRSIAEDLGRDDRRKKTCYVAWVYRMELVGHSSISHIRFGEDAHIHLHIWKEELRNSGLGSQLVERSARMFMHRFQLKRIVCEPWAGNPAPNKTVVKAGFKLERTYRTKPGTIQPEQVVNRYVLES